MVILRFAILSFTGTASSKNNYSRHILSKDSKSMYKKVNKTSRHPKKGSHFDLLALGVEDRVVTGWVATVWYLLHYYL